MKLGVIENELGGALHLRVRHKANTTRKFQVAKLKAKAKRVTGGAPEVMIKITGFGKGAAHVKAHLEYISRNGKVELETDAGEILAGKAAVSDYFEQWRGSMIERPERKNQRDSAQIVLSMPPGEDPEVVRRSVRLFAERTFGGKHEYVFALHTDAKHPHCHLTVKSIGFHGKRLHIARETPQQWREAFVDALEQNGVAAEATPRRVRGVVKKAEKQVIRHIEAGDKTHSPRISLTKTARELAAVNELRGQGAAEARPWEAAIEKNSKETRAFWLAAANELAKSADNADKALSIRIRGFVQGMPPVETAKQADVSRLRVEFQKKEPGRASIIKDHNKGLSNGDHQKATLRGVAGIQQRNLAADQTGTSAETVAGLRHLSSSDLVRHRQRPEMLVHANALNSVDDKGAGNHGVRREGDRAS